MRCPQVPQRRPFALRQTLALSFALPVALRDIETGLAMPPTALVIGIIQFMGVEIIDVNVSQIVFRTGNVFVPLEI